LISNRAFGALVKEFGREDLGVFLSIASVGPTVLSAFWLFGLLWLDWDALAIRPFTILQI